MRRRLWSRRCYHPASARTRTETCVDTPPSAAQAASAALHRCRCRQSHRSERKRGAAEASAPVRPLRTLLPGAELTGNRSLFFAWLNRVRDEIDDKVRLTVAQNEGTSDHAVFK